MLHFEGVRKRLFGSDNLLSKLSLCFFDEKTKPCYYSKHIVDNALVADFSAVLYHYHFIDGFRVKVEGAVKEKNYTGSSRSYRKVLAGINDSPDLSFVCEGTLKLTDVEDLVENGFLIMSDDYRTWADSE
jgi:hypothetical protein